MKLAEWMAKDPKHRTDESVADGTGVDRATISRLRRGVAQPSWDLAAKLKRYTRGAVTADDFLPELEGAR